MTKNSELMLPADRMCFALYSGARSIIANYRPYLDQLDMTYPQYLVYLVLFPNDGMLVTQIGVELALDSGTLTPLLKRMEQKGLVARTRGQEDERKVLVSLTKQARLLESQVINMQYQVQCTTGLESDELLELRSQLNKLTKNLRDNAKLTNDQS